MTLYLPGWMWIAIAAALYLFYAVNKSNKNRRKNMHARFEERQEQLLQTLREQQHKDADAQVSDTTKDD